MMRVENFLEGLSEEEIEVVGTYNQVVVISDENKVLSYFDTVEAANEYVAQQS
jgi:hypothetical protein|tara:strand:- start:113 stop:271 length:159 start_codon:yes stop_codon:yes gene_type:complete